MGEITNGTTILYDTITTVPASAIEFSIGYQADRVIINTSGTGIPTITFKTKFSSDDTSPDAIQGFNPATSLLAASTSSNNETWIFDGVLGLYSIVVTVTALSGGNLTVKARGVTV